MPSLNISVARHISQGPKTKLQELGKTLGLCYPNELLDVLVVLVSPQRTPTQLPTSFSKAETRTVSTAAMMPEASEGRDELHVDATLPSQTF